MVYSSFTNIMENNVIVKVCWTTRHVYLTGRHVGLSGQHVFFPTCQVRVVRYFVGGAAPPPSFFLLPSSFFLLPSSFLLPPSSSPDLICQLLIAVSLARSHLPALDRSGPRRTLSASSWSQWASPDLHCQLSIAVGLAGPQPARFGSLWASPGLNRRDSARRGPRRTSTGPQRPDRMPDRTSEDMPDGMPHRYARLNFRRSARWNAS